MLAPKYRGVALSGVVGGLALGAANGMPMVTMYFAEDWSDVDGGTAQQSMARAS